MKKITIYIICIFILSFNVYAEGYLCSYKFKEDIRIANFERIDNYFIKKYNNKHTNLSILHEDSTLIILGELLYYLEDDFSGYFTAMVDKEKKEFIGNSINITYGSSTIGGACVIY